MHSSGIVCLLPEDFEKVGWATWWGRAAEGGKGAPTLQAVLGHMCLTGHGLDIPAVGDVKSTCYTGPSTAAKQKVRTEMKKDPSV